MSDRTQPHWLVRPKTIRGLWIAGGIVLAILVALDLLIDRHPVFGIEAAFGFYAWYGLLACLAMVIAAKALGSFLKRPEDYYDD